eukprot:3901319-Rhodomonas_salina.1
MALIEGKSKQQQDGAGWFGPWAEAREGAGRGSRGEGQWRVGRRVGRLQAHARDRTRQTHWHLQA